MLISLSLPLQYLIVPPRPQSRAQIRRALALRKARQKLPVPLPISLLGLLPGSLPAAAEDCGEKMDIYPPNLFPTPKWAAFLPPYVLRVSLVSTISLFVIVVY